ALVGPDFLLQWGDLTVDELFQRIRTTMPQDSPSSLSAQTYVDIVAYILESNKFPAGKEDLKRDADVLKAIKITKGKWARGGSRHTYRGPTRFAVSAFLFRLQRF